MRLADDGSRGLKQFLCGKQSDNWRIGLCLGILYLILFYTPWNFKFISSLPRVLDVHRWWAPFIFPESVMMVGAVLISLTIKRDRLKISLPRLFTVSLTLYWIGLLVSSVFNEFNEVYLTRVVILQYALPLVFFFLVVRHIQSLNRLRACMFFFVTGGLLLFLLATPVYFLSFHAFAPWSPLGWPSSRVLYNRMVFSLVHNEPAMLYDNVTFGNFLNISQLLVTLLPLAIGWLFTAGSTRQRIAAGLATIIFLLHICLGHTGEYRNLFLRSRMDLDDSPAGGPDEHRCGLHAGLHENSKRVTRRFFPGNLAACPESLGGPLGRPGHHAGARCR